jgi:hypothetical protein
MSDTADGAVERLREISRTYDRVGGQIAWLVGERKRS